MQMRPLLCYITDRTAFPGDESERRRLLLEKIAQAARAALDFVQLREKDLPGRDFEDLAIAALRAIHENTPPGTASRTRLLINSRVDVALAAAADGVHLPSADLSPTEVRQIWSPARTGAAPLLSLACHTLDEVRAANDAAADFALFAPVFGKKDTCKKDAPSVLAAGLDALHEACREPIPVLALGGVTLANAHACFAAGAAGIAAIRLFQEHEIAAVVRELRS